MEPAICECPFSALLLTGEFPNERQKQLDAGVPCKNPIDYSKKKNGGFPTSCSPPPPLLSPHLFYPHQPPSPLAHSLHLILLSHLLITPNPLFHLHAVTSTGTPSSSASSFTSLFTSHPPRTPPFTPSTSSSKILIISIINLLTLRKPLAHFLKSVQPTTTTTKTTHYNILMSTSGTPPPKKKEPVSPYSHCYLFHTWLHRSLADKGRQRS